jgi:hypothetical protein
MNSHTGLQARLHDYEQNHSQSAPDILRSADGNEDHDELDAAEASAVADVDVDTELGDESPLEALEENVVKEPEV